MLNAEVSHQPHMLRWSGLEPEALAEAIEEIARFCLMSRRQFAAGVPKHLIRWAMDPINSLAHKALEAQQRAINAEMNRAWDQGDFDKHRLLVAMKAPLNAASAVYLEETNRRLDFISRDWYATNASVYGPL